MGCKNGHFWIGLGVGSILGAVAYHLSRTERAKKLESDIYQAIHRIGRDAERTLEDVEEKALRMGVKAAEAGARAADKVADEADKLVVKAKDKWDK